MTLATASFAALAAARGELSNPEANPFERSVFGNDWGVLNNDIFFGGAYGMFGLSPATRAFLFSAAPSQTASRMEAGLNAPGSTEDLSSFASSLSPHFLLNTGGPVSGGGGGSLSPSATTGGPGLFYLVSGGNWDAVGAWGPDVNTHPNAQSATITDLQFVSGAVVQNVVAGVNLGVIDHNPTTAGNSGLSVHWTITTDNLIVLNNGLSPAQINNSQPVGNNSLTINGTAGLSLTSDLIITNANATGLLTISAPIVGNGGVTTGGIGTTFLTGDNTFYGATIVNGGTLNLGGEHSLGGGGSGPTLGLGTSSVTVNTGGTLLFSGQTADRIRDAAPIFLSGGRLDTGGLSEFTPGTGVLPGMGALTLTSTSTIDLGAGMSIIAFADSSGETWAGALKILNWTGTPGTGDGTDQIYFGTNGGGLTSPQLDQISFYSDAAGLNFLGTGIILSDGEVVPAPEPATWVGGAAAALGALAFVRRRKPRSQAVPS